MRCSGTLPRSSYFHQLYRWWLISLSSLPVSMVKLDAACAPFLPLLRRWVGNVTKSQVLEEQPHFTLIVGLGFDSPNSKMRRRPSRSKWVVTVRSVLQLNGGFGEDDSSFSTPFTRIILFLLTILLLLDLLNWTETRSFEVRTFGGQPKLFRLVAIATEYVANDES